MSNIVLNTLTFVGQGFTNAASWFWERSAGVFNGFRSLSARVTPTATKNVVMWKGAFPVLVAANSECGCVDDLAFEPTLLTIDVRFDKKASPTHRNDVQTMIEQLVITQQFRDSVKLLITPP